MAARAQTFFEGEGARRRAVRTVGVLADVTERKLAEEALRDSEAQARLLADAMPHLVWAADARGVVDYVNRRADQYDRIVRHEDGTWDWTPAVHPEDAAATAASWRAALEAQVPYEAEQRLRTRAGDYRWHLSRALPMRDGRGAVVRWFGTATDIHERKQEEATQRILADAGRALAESRDVDEVASALASVLVPARADFCVVLLGGATPRAFVTHVDEERAARARSALDETRVGALLAAPGPSESAVVVPQAEPWAALGARTVVRVPLAAWGRSLGVLQFGSEAAARESTEVPVWAEELARRAGLALDRAELLTASELERRKAEQALHAKDEFLAVVSHELRTPLQSILGWATMLSQRPDLDAKARHGLSVIERNANAQTKLIEDLLDVSRVMTGKLSLRFDAVDLRSVVDGALASVRLAAEVRGVALVVAERERAPVIGDPDRLGQVLWNLLSNAIKFTPRGGRVTVRLASNGPWCELSVDDTGEGIDPAFLPHVFERFRQADSSSKRAHGGLGLGLALVRHLVEAHGGTVEASSEGRGRGARFMVRLPRAEAPRAAVAPTPAEHVDAEAARVESALPDLAGVRVLVVEDEADSRELVETVLASCHARVRVASSAAEALAKLREEAPDVLVSDIGMPDEDGYALLAKVRRLPEAEGGRVPAIALTAYAQAEDRARAARAGFDGYLPKPADPGELVALVASLARKS